MRNNFLSQLETLQFELIYTGKLCEEAISTAIEAFVNGDESVTDKVRAMEEKIDEKETLIESMCYKLLLSQQPVAIDLRTVSCALKMITDLERIGDQAADIADLVKYTKSKVGSVLINNMAKEAASMVVDAVEAFANKDLEAANAVIDRDDKVDEMFKAAKGEIIKSIKEEQNSEDAEAIADVLIIVKYLERIADHATNVAEWAVFSMTGVHESHHDA